MFPAMILARRTFARFVFAAGLFAACDAGEPAKLVATDLTEKGIPISIQAPEGAEISESMIALETALDVRKDEFNLMVELYVDNRHASGDAKTIAAEQKELASKGDDFARMLVEEDHGYLYATKSDSGEDFHFLFVRVLEGKEIHFSEALTLFPQKEKDVRVMYDAVKK
jgi:hypothetical protein